MAGILEETSCMKIVLFLVLIFAMPFSASAATLYFSPSSGTQTIGKPFTVTVYAASTDQALNAISAQIQVPSERFTVVSASSVGSVVNFWVQQPTVSGNTVMLEGVVMNPGYQGAGAKVASFVLVPRSEGSGTLTFSDASVLANDGQGTSILTSTGSASYTITESLTTPVEPQAPETVEVAPHEEVDTTVPATTPPQVTYYDAEVGINDLVALRGTTYGRGVVELLVYQGGSLLNTEYAYSAPEGDFAFVLAKHLPAGSYTLRLRVTTEDGSVSPESDTLPLEVRTDWKGMFGWLGVGHLALFALVILASIGLLGVLHAIGFDRLFRMTREIHARENEARDVTRRVFDILKKDLNTHVRKIRNASEDRILTKEELEFLASFEEELDEAETVLKRKKSLRRKKSST